MEFEEIFNEEGSITSLTIAPNEPNNLYILKQGGLLYKYNLKTDEKDIFLDFTDSVKELYREKPLGLPPHFADERGLLKLVFHPEYNTSGSLFNGTFIVVHSSLTDKEKYDSLSDSQVSDPNHMTCISQFLRKDSYEETMLTKKDILCVPEPQGNHNGGEILFGPHGFLWIGLGDGGGAGDKHGILLDDNEDEDNYHEKNEDNLNLSNRLNFSYEDNLNLSNYRDSLREDNEETYLGFAQDLDSYHGKILRIEIQQLTQPIERSIPQDNPLVGKNIGREAIAAWGFRNPWSMTFDPKGRLFVGDVGQNRFESVKMVTSLGENHGWRAYEGYEVFDNKVKEYIEELKETVILPIATYPREYGIALTGITYYKNSIIVADYKGNIFSLKKDGTWNLDLITNIGINIHGIGKTGKDSLYIIGFDSENKIGRILKLKNNSENVRLTDEDIDIMIQNGINKAMTTKSILRNKGDFANVKMHFAIRRKEILEPKLIYSMDDAWEGSIDIAKKKANTAFIFSSNENALTSRTIGDLSQPGGALWQIGNSNLEGGIIEFAGGVPLYKEGILVGGLGVSGDGVDQDEIVAIAASLGFEPQSSIRSDTVSNITYTKNIRN